MLVAADLVGDRVRSPKQLTTFAKETKVVDQAALLQRFSELRQSFSDLAATSGYPPDKIAKGSEALRHLLDQAFPTQGEPESS